MYFLLYHLELKITIYKYIYIYSYVSIQINLPIILTEIKVQYVLLTHEFGYRLFKIIKTLQDCELLLNSNNITLTQKHNYELNCFTRFYFCKHVILEIIQCNKYLILPQKKTVVSPVYFTGRKSIHCEFICFTAKITSQTA